MTFPLFVGQLHGCHRLTDTDQFEMPARKHQDGTRLETAYKTFFHIPQCFAALEPNRYRGIANDRTDRHSVLADEPFVFQTMKTPFVTLYFPILRVGSQRRATVGDEAEDPLSFFIR